MRAPVLALPERVELLVVHQPALRAPALGRVAGVGRSAPLPSPCCPSCRASRPGSARWRSSRSSSGPSRPSARSIQRPSRVTGEMLPSTSVRLSLHRVGRGQLAGEQREPVRRSGSGRCASGSLAEARARPRDRAVVDLDVPAPAALADELVGDAEAVAAGPLGVDRVGERAVDEVGVDRVRRAGRARAGPRPGRACGARAPCGACPRSFSRPRTSGPSGLRPEATRASVSASVEIAKVSPLRSAAGEHLGHLGPAAEGADGPGAERRRARAGSSARRAGRGRGRERLDDQPRRELGVGLRHPAERPLGVSVRAVATSGHARRFCQTGRQIWLASQWQLQGRRVNRLTPPCWPY